MEPDLPEAPASTNDDDGCLVAMGLALAYVLIGAFLAGVFGASVKEGEAAMWVLFWPIQLVYELGLLFHKEPPV